MYAFAREHNLPYDRLIHSHDPEETLAVSRLEELSGVIEPRTHGIKPIESQILAVCLWSLYNKHQ